MFPLEDLSQSFLMHFPSARAATHSPSQVTITANVGKLVAISGHCLTCCMCLYTYATKLHPKGGVTLHMPQYRKVIPRQVAML